MMMSALYGLLSPAGPKARLSTLIFHRVLPAPDPLFPEEMHAARFEGICRWLAGWFNVLPLDDAARALSEGTLPARALAITFDDGYADNHDVALPILQRHGLNATFFVATSFLDGGRMWNDTLTESLRRTDADSLDLGAAGVPGVGRFSLRTTAERRAAIDAVVNACKYLPLEARADVVDAVARASAASMPADLMMSSAQVKALHAAGMRIGGHTASHPILARLSGDEARREIATGRQRLEALTQSSVSLFAYPNGKPGRDFNDDHVAMVREAGFDSAVTTAWGTADRATDRFLIPRFTPWDHGRVGFGLRLARNLRHAA